MSESGSKRDRRGFLRDAAIVAAALVAGVVGVWRWVRGARGAASGPSVRDSSGRGDPAAQVEALLRKEYGDLDVDPDAYARFASAFLTDRRRRWRPGRELSARDRWRFLMSTDFFQNGADESRRLRFVAYYEPYASPCYNPLARPPEA